MNEMQHIEESPDGGWPVPVLSLPAVALVRKQFQPLEQSAWLCRLTLLGPWRRLL